LGAMMRALLLLLLALSLPLHGQLRETINVTVVEVPVTVVDRAGNPVRGLTKDQFEVSVDGKKVAVTGFDTIDMRTIDERSQAAPAAPLPAAAYRNFLLLFDFSGSTPGTIARAQGAASEFVSTQLKRRDLCAVATFSIEQGLQILTSFTSDRDLLQHVIENVLEPTYIKVQDPLKLAAPPRYDVDPKNDKARARQAEKNEAVRAIIERHNLAAQRAWEDEQRGRLSTEFRDLGSLARLLDRLPGQKQIIFLSEGFDPALVQGRGNLSEKATQEENERIDRGEIWKVTTEQRFGSNAAATEIRQMAELFKRSDVRLHAIDIKGLRGEVDAFSGVQQALSTSEGLHLITRPTGGQVFKNATDLRRNFEELMRQQELVYVLAFETKRTFTPGAFHEIRVKVPSARGVQVTHRAGYYETSPYPPSEFEQTLSLAGLLMTESERTEVPLTITASPLPSQGKVPVVIEVPAEGLLKDGDENVVTADLYVYAFDSQNHIRDFLQQRLGVDLTKNGQRLRDGGLRYVSSLDLPPGQYVLKALVRVDESGRIGLTRRVVDVPSAKISATFLHPVQNGVNVAAPGRSEVAVMAFSTPEQRYVPVVRPIVRSNMALALFGAERRTGFSPSFAPPMDGLKPVLRLLESAEDRVLLELDASGLKAGEYTLLLEGAALPFRIE
ncbi:MAG TPA: VWA domain-containing protein, partial [Thermoanaerobaculia bacterium]|nr:VWA domain-containing protein [Thermoanaerobaculia bacterium]